MIPSRIDFSSHGQPIYLRRFLSPSVPATLVHVGAGDGVFQSNSREFLLEGWQGVLIESDPALFERLNRNVQAFPNARCVPAAGIPLTPLLEESGFGSLFGILFIRSAGVDVLRGLDFARFRPMIIAGGEAFDNPALNCEKYAFLTGLGYAFCGVSGLDSVWVAPELKSRTVLASPPGSLPPSGLPSGLNAAPDLPVIKRHSLDLPLVDGNRTVRAGWGATIAVQGWAFDDDSGPDTAAVLEVVENATGRVTELPCVRYPRPDVAAHFGVSAAEYSGYRAEIDSRPFRPGVYQVALVLAKPNALASRLRGIVTLELSLHEFENSARQGMAARFLHGSGIEIGALQRKLAAPGWCTVRYIDRMPLEDLVAHYPELGQLPLQAPDIIDDGELLTHIASESQDFVVANHFFEHSRNPIRTLFNFARVLRAGGTLFMAVPDKRFTKDVLRPPTPYETLRETFIKGERGGLEALYREWAEHWEGARGFEIESKASELQAQNYSMHYNVWALSHLLDFLLRARADFAVPFEIAAAVTSDNENILVLTRLADETRA